MMFKSLMFFILLQVSHHTFASCQYYAYVSYGPAMLDGFLHQKQNAFKSSGLRKNTKGFKAVYTSYNQITLANGFTIENIGPYDTESVAYIALTSFIADLKVAGYVRKSARHTFPGILLKNKNPCD